MIMTNVPYPPFFGDLALGLQFGSGLSSLQDAMVLLGVDIQGLLFEHLSPWQGDTLHCGNSATSRNHLMERETQTGTQCLEPLPGKSIKTVNTDTNKQLQCKWLNHYYINHYSILIYSTTSLYRFTFLSCMLETLQSHTDVLSYSC